jgi:hypothetical protein
LRSCGRWRRRSRSRRKRRPPGLGSASGCGPGYPRSPRRRSEAAPVDPRP